MNSALRYTYAREASRCNKVFSCWADAADYLVYSYIYTIDILF